MPHRAAALLLLVLAVPTFAQAPAFHQTDKRLPITLTPVERNQTLYEMREFLHGFHNIHLALANGDMRLVALTARTMAPFLDRLPESMRERTPEEFVQIAIALRESLEALARSAETRGNAQEIHGHLAEVVTYCSGCHDTFRLQATPPRTRR